MVLQHSLSETDQTPVFASQIQRHSGDRSVAYQIVEGKEVALSYYLPPHHSPQKKYPVFVFIHGGGWSGEKIFEDQQGRWQGDYLGYLARYYADRGFVSVSINYRLARQSGQCPGYQLIDCYEDCVCAMDHVLSEADVYGLDLDYVFVLGESSGGHLAALLANRYVNGTFRFRAAFDINAILDFMQDPVWIQYIPKETPHAILAPLSFEERAKWLSPMHSISEQTPPTVLIHGAADTVVNPLHSEQYALALREKNIVCEHHVIEQTQHAFLLAEFTKQTDACKIGVNIIDAYLQKIGIEIQL